MVKRKIKYEEFNQHTDKRSPIQSGRKTPMPISSTRSAQFKKEGPIIAIDKKIQFDSKTLDTNELKHDRKGDKEEDEEYLEEMSLIATMWENLGVTKKYKEVFEEAIKIMTKRNSKQFLMQEKANLKKFHDNLMVIYSFYYYLLYRNY